MQTEQKYRLRFYIDRSQLNEPDVYMDGVYTIDELINKGYLTPIQTRKVYRWKHTGDILEQTSRFTNCWSYKTLQLNNIIDNITFQECLAAGLIIESEEVVEPEQKPLTPEEIDRMYDEPEPKPEPLQIKVGTIIKYTDKNSEQFGKIFKVLYIGEIRFLCQLMDELEERWVMYKNNAIDYFEVVEPTPAPVELIEGHRYKLECLLECMFPVGEICYGTFNKSGFWFGRVGKVHGDSCYFKVLEDLTESEGR